jgi:uncharacterized protein (DUF1501 family)
MKAIMHLVNAGGCDSIGMFYDKRQYEYLTTVRGPIMPAFDDLIDIVDENHGCHPLLPKIAKAINDGDAAVLWNVGRMFDENNSQSIPFRGSHSNQHSQTNGLGGEDAHSIGIHSKWHKVAYPDWLNMPVKANMSAYPSLMNVLYIGYDSPYTGEIHAHSTDFDEHRVLDGINWKEDTIIANKSKIQDMLYNVGELVLPPIDYIHEDMDSDMKLAIEAMRNAEVFGHDKGQCIYLSRTKGTQWDTHRDQVGAFERNHTIMDNQISWFIEELKANDLWDDAIFIWQSEFGRTVRSNGSDGTDHGWGGHYLIMGGAVKGNQIHGKPFVYGDPGFTSTGRIDPTTSWDQINTECFRWMGLTMAEALTCTLEPEGAFESTIGVIGDIEPMDSAFISEPEEPEVPEEPINKEESIMKIVSYIGQAHTFGFDAVIGETYSWLKDGEAIAEVGPKIDVYPVVESLAGTYLGTATDGESNTRTVEIVFEVRDRNEGDNEALLLEIARLEGELVIVETALASALATGAAQAAYITTLEADKALLVSEKAVLVAALASATAFKAAMVEAMASNLNSAPEGVLLADFTCPTCGQTNSVFESNGDPDVARCFQCKQHFSFGL